MIKELNPKFHLVKNYKSVEKADVWPADVIVDKKSKEAWVLTSEAVFTPFISGIGFYSHRLPPTTK